MSWTKTRYSLVSNPLNSDQDVLSPKDPELAGSSTETTLVSNPFDSDQNVLRQKNPEMSKMEFGDFSCLEFT